MGIGFLSSKNGRRCGVFIDRPDNHECLQVLAKVGDNQVLLQSIKGSAYYDAFGDRASAWERRLTDLDEVKRTF